MSQKYNDAVVVDEQDNELGHMQMPDAYRQGKILRVTHILITDFEGQVLLQQRCPNIMAPGLWQEAASGHVDWGDSYHETAQKELSEEMGISGIELAEIDYFFKQEDFLRHYIKRWHKVFHGKYKGEVKPNHEVSSVQWIGVEDLIVWYNQNPQEFTPSMDRMLELLRKRV